MADKFHGGTGVKAGQTSVSIPVRLLSTAGAAVTAKVAANVTAYYWRQGGSPTSITVSDLAAINSAYSSGGWKEASATNMPGLYRLDLPDAAVATGADWVAVAIVVSGSMDYEVFVPLESKGGSENNAELTSGTYGLPQLVRSTTPANALTVDGSGKVANNDKAGYSLASLDTMVVHNGTAQAGAAGSITLAAGASATDSLYVGAIVNIYSGTGVGQTRTITIYNGTTKVATVGRNWTTTPDNTSVYRVLSLAVPKVNDSLEVTANSVNGNVTGSVASVTGAVGSVTGNVGGNVVGSVASVTNDVGITQAGADKVWGSTTRTLSAFGFTVTVATNNDKAGYALTAGERTSIADAILTRDWTVVTGEAARSALNALRFLRNRWTVSGATLTVYKEDGTTAAYTETVTTTAGANPVTGLQ